MKSRFRRYGLLAAALLASVAIRASGRIADVPVIDVTTNVVYGTVDGEALRLDLYRPRPRNSEAVRLPAVVMIHGGGWQGGSKDDNRPFAMSLARSGYVAVSCDYRLVTPTGHRYPAQLDDVQRVVRWMRANANRYGIDPDRIAAFGHSAGAHLAALLGTVDTRDNGDAALAAYSSRVQCVIDTDGPVDFTDPSHPPVGHGQMPLVQALFGPPASAREAQNLYRAASPVAHVDDRTAPFLILHATEDKMVPIQQSEILAATLKAHGVEVVFIRVPDGHLFQRVENQRLWLDETRSFLDRHFHAHAQ